jgi:hypothetical protein
MSKNKRGRPRTNVTSREYARKKLIYLYRSYVGEFCIFSLKDDGLLIDDKPPKGLKRYLMNDFGRRAFSDGIKFGLLYCAREIVPEMVETSMDLYGVNINISGEARRYLKWKKEGRPVPTERFPSDILRKARKPILSKQEILRFTRLVKEISEEAIPYISLVAKKLNLAEEDVKLRISEAKRQGRKISVAKGSGEEEFILLD